MKKENDPMIAPKTPFLFSLFLAACGASDQGETTAPPAAPSAYYIHCLGRDVHIADFQRPFSTSLQINDEDPYETKELNPSSSKYYPICKKSDPICEISITQKTISIEAKTRPTEAVEVHKAYVIDRMTGEFSGSEIMKAGVQEATIFVAVARCEKSSSPKAPSAI
jgi:hypothetical protein